MKKIDIELLYVSNSPKLILTDSKIYKRGDKNKRESQILFMGHWIFHFGEFINTNIQSMFFQSFPADKMTFQ